ncbi:C45 family autoproteolytic acyltransferase/hydolase [Celeribacter sp.]|jgi:predicted choloylglycine hydrolase|uniref:C45 family autoproteolytic acyltransferase/hydolase n=1 Tax=Celeribacter sp. TaxID=1890673 RepID=UPI003A92D9B5
MFDPMSPELGSINAEGTPTEIGRTLGAAGRVAVEQVLLPSDYWKAVTGAQHQTTVERISHHIQRLFPSIWEELEGLAEGLDLPLQQVVAWNCRGDLMTNVPDGCTTIQLPAPVQGTSHVIAHNEDGIPEFRGHAFLLEAAPSEGPSFMSFCYPGSIPGHTFGVNAAGLVQTINNLRLREVSPDLSRMVVGRAVLGCDSLQSALDLLSEHNASGGFHMTLAQAGDPRVMSIEFGADTCSIHPVTAPSAHANHALHMTGALQTQLVTASSRDRQARATQLLAEGVNDPLLILRDNSGAGLPLHRTDPDDPDNENTLATGVFHLSASAVEWSIYDQTSDRPVFTGRKDIRG